MKFIFILILVFHSLVADLCDTEQYSYTDQWTGGANGIIKIRFGSNVSGWKVSVRFASEVKSFVVWSGKSHGCSNSVCSFGNADYNGKQSVGVVLDIGFQVSFMGHSAPEIVSIVLNGVEQCGGSDSGTTSTLGTTPASSTTSSSQVTTASPDKNHRGVFVPWPNKVLGMYILLADDFTSFGSNKEWTPELHQYQQRGANVLFFSFINPSTMSVPPAFKNLAKTRGTNTPGGVPTSTVIIFAIGGIGYSEKYNPWKWLTSRSAAEAMAIEVAKWPELYGCDGIDLDIENGAGENSAAGPNMIYFIKKLRELVPSIIISQPVYGYPQIAAETYIVNHSWDHSGNDLNGVDSIGLMVYQGTETLNWVQSYTTPTGPGVTCRAPNSAMILGSPGTISPSELSSLVSATLNNNYRGIMVWYASVKNGFQYGPGDDATTKSVSQEAFIKAMASLSSF